MPTSNYCITLKTAAGAAVTSGTVHVVPQGGTYPTNAIALTHQANGIWKETGTIADDEYSLYYNGVVHPYYQRFWIGENKITLISNKHNSDGTMTEAAIDEVRDGMAVATEEVNGLQSAADKAKDDLVKSNFDVNGDYLLPSQALVYRDNNSITWDETTKIVSWSGEIQIYNGDVQSQIQIAAGQIDFSALTGFYLAYYIPVDAYWKTTATVIAISDIDILTRRFSSASYTPAIKDPRMIPLFTFDSATNILTSFFQKQNLNDKNILSENFDANKNYKYLLNSLIYGKATDNSITWNSTTKILTWSDSLRIFSGNTISQIVIAAGNIDFSAYAGTWWLAYLSSEALLTGNAEISVTSANILFRRFGPAEYTPDIKVPGTIPLFLVNIATGNVTSPFLQFDFNTKNDISKINSFIDTKTNLIFSHTLEITWDATTKILAFGDLYIHNGTLANRIKISAGQIDFSDASFIGSWWVGYYQPAEGFFTGTTSADITTANISWRRLSGGSNTPAINNEKTIILFHYHVTNNRVTSPFMRDDIDTDFLIHKGTVHYDFDTQKNNTEWFNRYPNVYAKIPNFVQKYMDMVHTRIVLWGDSIFAKATHTSVLDVDDSIYPPTFVSKMFGAYLWENLRNKASYKRFDAVGFYTEIGSWSHVQSADWDDTGTRDTYTRISSSTNAGIQFTLGTDLNQSGFNFIDRTDTAGTESLTITIAEGNGYVEMHAEGSESWVEANGTTFSQKETDEGDRRTNSISQRRTYFRKVTAHKADSVTVTIAKTASEADRMLYWGIEHFDIDKGYTSLVNIARGGLSIDELENYMDDEVIDRKPDLVILELPLINQVLRSPATIAQVCNNIQDVVWGDRTGAENLYSLKNQANDWADFEVLLIIPHHRVADMNADDSFNDLGDGYTEKEIWDAVKKLIISKGDLYYIDMAVAMDREIKSNPLYSTYYAGFAASSAAGLTYSDDGTHQNDKGTLVYAKNICPIFDITNL